MGHLRWRSITDDEASGDPCPRYTTHGEAVNVLAGDARTGVKSVDVVAPNSWSGAGGYINPNCTYGPRTQQYSLTDQP